MSERSAYFPQNENIVLAKNSFGEKGPDNPSSHEENPAVAETKKISPDEAFTGIFKLDEKIKALLARLSVSEIMPFLDRGEELYAKRLSYGLETLSINFAYLIEKISFLEEKPREKALAFNKKFNLESNAFGPGYVPPKTEEALKEHLDFLKKETLNAVEQAKDWKDLYQVYEQQMARMDIDLVREMATKIHGFSRISANLLELLPQVKTFNEFLHLLHTYVLNNENLREELESWKEGPDQNGDEEKHSIKAYGLETSMAKEIYQQFLQAWNLGDSFREAGWEKKPPYIVDIVSLENLLQIVVRDRGHALNLIIDDLRVDQEGKILVKYSLPKIINLEMIKNLPGISEIRDNYARGQWKVEANNLGEEIIAFVKKVPTDSDRANREETLATDNLEDKELFQEVETGEKNNKRLIIEKLRGFFKKRS